MDKAKNALSTQSVGPKISWLKAHDHEAFSRADYFLTASSYLVMKLTGRAVIDHHQASFWVPFYDFESRCWNRAFCERYLPLHKLPEIIEVADVAGEITRLAAEETGLAPGTPVTAGTSDAFAEAIKRGGHW